jgi:hypothetical protein
MAQHVFSGGQWARAEHADPTRDHHRASADPGAVAGGHGECAVAPLQSDGLLAQAILRIERRRLTNELVHQFAPPNGGEAGHVEDRLLGIHGADLAARFGQRVEHGS